MTFLSLLALAGAMLLLAITPGPGVFATVSRALASGFNNAAIVVMGIIAGDLIFMVMAIYGLAAVAEMMGSLFNVVKYVGAAYLVWLGIGLLRAESKPVEVEGVVEHSWRANFFTGLFITLGNPKVILFYLGFLPTFVDLAALTTLDVISIAVVISTVLGGAMLGYAFLAAKARNLFKDPKAERIMNRSAGSVMIATGAVLASK